MKEPKKNFPTSPERKQAKSSARESGESGEQVYTKLWREEE